MYPEIALIGAACSIAGTDAGSEQAPGVMQQSQRLKNLDLPLAWDRIVFSRGQARQLSAMDNVIHYSEAIAKRTSNAASIGELFLTIGGDHSCAIGTWSGAAHALRDQGDLGLIWVDAHLDAHTPNSSDTGNIHGMPVAHLLGFGEQRLSQILDSENKLKPSNIVLVGIRSYEPAERALLEKLGVRVFYIEEVKQRGIDVVLKEAYNIVTTNTAAYGLSIDVDGFDPQHAPAVHTTVDDGINAIDFIAALKHLPKTNMIGAEIAEFCPHLDKENATEQLIVDLVSALFGELFAKS